MVRIIQRPLTIEGLKLYQEKSPSKWADKFGDLDLNNIPKEYMKKMMFPTIQQDGTTLTDTKGNPVMHEEEYFDAIMYRKHLIATTREKTPVIGEYAKPAVTNVDSAPSTPSTEPSNIGGELK